MWNALLCALFDSGSLNGFNCDVKRLFSLEPVLVALSRLFCKPFIYHTLACATYL